MTCTLNLKLSITSLSLIAAFGNSSVWATELPPAFKAEIEALEGVTIGADGGIKAGNKIYIPLLPADYDAANSTMKLADLLPLPDGSVAAGNIQFAPITSEPGSLPKLPENFTPIAGNSLPPDFAPPAGFIPSASAPLPSGVIVPAKTPADMVKDLEDAGTFPKGFVTFNPDGSITAGGNTMMPFAPNADKQGRFDPTAGLSSTMTLVDGVVTFPDGTQMVPLVAGSTPGSKTLPPTFAPRPGTALPKEVNLPPQFDIPKNMPLPPGMMLPPGVNIPSDYEFMIPPGTVMPAGSNIPAGVRASPDVLIPPGVIMPSGTDVTTANLPAGTVFLPNGSIIVPGTSIPSGMAPPASWIPPSGVVVNADGGYDVPPPPPGGYPTPPAPLTLNADGSMVMADGTNFRPPLFVGKVGDDGVLSNAGYSMSSNFAPSLATGATVAITQAVTLDWKTGKINYPVGTKAPAGAITNADGSFSTQPPANFRPAATDGGGNYTITLGAGVLPPRGAIANPDGTFTFDAAPPPPPAAGFAPPIMDAATGRFVFTAPQGFIAPPGTLVGSDGRLSYDGPMANGGKAYIAHLPDAPKYASRFTDTSKALEYAQSNGQGALEVTETGVIKNRFGEIMVYDSDGNLAPASRAASVVVTMPPPVITQVGIGRFSNVAEAVEYAQNNGQGQLQTSEYGVITNQNGQTMVYDSDGNLAPAMNPVATVLPTGAPLPYAVAVKHAQQQSQNKGQGPLEIQADGTVKNQNGETMVFDSAGNLAPAPRAASLNAITIQSDIPRVEISRFSNISDAVDYAQNNGQGQLKTSDNGVITNRFGEIMVFDSSGNLAPASRAASVVVTMPPPVITQVGIGRFSNVAEAVEFAQKNGQGQLQTSDDGVITNRFGETMVYDSGGNLAPATKANSTVLPTGAPPPDPEALEQAQEQRALEQRQIVQAQLEQRQRVQAQNNGQGPLEVQANGTIKNQHGETMVMDSDGNLAPAPVPQPAPVTAQSN